MMLAQPDFHSTRCVRYRYRYSACRRCAEACPHDAIDLGEEGIAIHPARCRNCALCASACQTEALKADNLDRIALLRAAAGKPRHVIACAPSGETGDSVVPCLGGLDAAVLAFLARRGIVADLRGRGHCERCEHAPHGPAQLALNLDALAHLRERVGNAAWAGLELADDGAGESRHDAGRRHLFRRLFGGRADAAMAAETARERPPAPLRAIRAAGPVSTARRELLQLLWPAAEGEQDDFSLMRHAALPLASLHLDPVVCTACEACARACPTAALQVQESGTAWHLAFDGACCVGCEVCLETCQPGALSEAEQLDGSVLCGGATVLMSLSKQRCGRCDRFFISRQPARMCPICEGDDADFAAIFG